jgi:hypothetical protein
VEVREETAICQPGREASEESHSADTLTSDILPPKLSK